MQKDRKDHQERQKDDLERQKDRTDTPERQKDNPEGQNKYRQETHTDRHTPRDSKHGGGGGETEIAVPLPEIVFKVTQELLFLSIVSDQGIKAGSAGVFLSLF